MSWSLPVATEIQEPAAPVAEPKICQLPRSVALPMEAMTLVTPGGSVTVIKLEPAKISLSGRPRSGRHAEAILKTYTRKTVTLAEQGGRRAESPDRIRSDHSTRKSSRRSC